MKLAIVHESLHGQPISFQELKKRKGRVQNIIVEHPRYKKVLDKIREHHLLSSDTLRAEGLFLTGETGVGKSTLLKRYTGMYPRRIVDGYTIIPILYTRVPVGATPKSVASKILLDLGDPAYDKGTENNQTSRILQFVQKCKLELIIIDEFQHLIDRDTQHVLNRASDWVKSFADDVGIPLLLCGMPESQKIFKHNAQLDRRFCMREELTAFKYGTKEEQIEFRGFLKSIDKELPFPNQSHLADIGIAERLYYASNGIQFYLMKVIEEATVNALKLGQDQLTQYDLSIAFQSVKISQRPYMRNPFSEDKFNLLNEMDMELRRMKRRSL